MTRSMPDRGMPMRIAAYCRVSTDNDDQLNSLQTQKNFFEEYAAKNSHVLYKIYADEGISGTKTKNRAQFNKLMADAGAGLFQMVVVKDISRFARNTVDLLSNTRKLKAFGIETLFITSNMSVLGHSEFVLTLYGALAQEESLNTSKRIKFSKRLNAQKGKVPNIVYGYDKKNGDYFNLSINPFEAETVKRIYALYVFEGIGQKMISSVLNNEGILTKRRCNWSQNAVSRILKNPLYTGRVINGKQEVGDFLTGARINRDEADWLVAERPELRIIDDDIFERAQRTAKSRKAAFHSDNERQSSRHLFSTLIKCRCCGHTFRRTVRTYRNTYVNWVCSGRNAGGALSCPNRTALDEAALFDEIKGYIVSLTAGGKNAAQGIAQELSRILGEKTKDRPDGQALCARLSKLKRDRQKYIEMNLNDIIGLSELKDRLKRIGSEIERAQTKLKSAGYPPKTGNGARGREVLNLEDISGAVSAENMTNAMMKRLIEKIVVDEEGNADIHFKRFSEATKENVPV